MWPPIARLVRWIGAAHIDLRLGLTGKIDRKLPPLRLRFVGDGDFVAVGGQLAELVLENGDVREGSRLLDIGCGVGRVALPLTGRVPRDVVYEGFDVVRGAVRWCRRRISRGNPNFRFRHVSVRNSEYSLCGAPAAEFRFPFPERTFNCAFAFSVFTHLTFPEMRQYLRESHRVLEPGGRLIATFFLLNEESTPRLTRLPPRYQFPVVDGPVRLTSSANPGEGVAVDEAALMAEIDAAGFRRHTVSRGQWSGHVESPIFQDLVVCEK
ncbi:MAG TPA: class I SAM-dependent methyltransferase [Thermoanaerobaculia bacterium]|nr:class I SAM-dependent methyltransferase [Thermoanaerobaculia bacterium]